VVACSIVFGHDRFGSTPGSTDGEKTIARGIQKSSHAGQIVDLAVGWYQAQALAMRLAVADIICRLSGAVSGGLDFSKLFRCGYIEERYRNLECPRKKQARSGVWELLHHRDQLPDHRWVCFMVVRGHHTCKRRGGQPKPAERHANKQEVLVTEIRDLLESKRPSLD